MALREILLFGHPILRMKASPLEAIDESVHTLVEDMIDTMLAAEGIGLAAPQVGETISLLIVNNGLLEEGVEPKAYINPAILEEDGVSVTEEGCLSIPDIREDVTRPESIRVTYQDIDGVQHDERCDSMLARVLLHEIDHLNGVLFVDRLSPMKRKLLSKKLRRIAAGDSAVETSKGAL